MPLTRKWDGIAANLPLTLLPEAFLHDRAKSIPLGLTVRERDIALPALYLVSDSSRLVNGQLLRANGGLVLL